jgi:tripartite-type tricarboxylate transporter receptor subunit TctC
VIETKAGAAGQVGAQVAASAKPDGYTLLAHLPSISGFEAVDKTFGRAPKFTRADFIPIARLTEGPMVLVVNDQQPYKSLKDLVDDAKKRPDQIIFSSSGLYGALHLPTALFMNAAGVQMRHLPTNGGGPALTAILGNNSQVLVTSIAAAIAQIKAGKLRALACFSPTRAASLPDVPTLKDSATMWNSRSGSACSRKARRRQWSPVTRDPKKSPKANSSRRRWKRRRCGGVLDQPEFAKFWDEDAKRVENAA